jgi:hypothetical protein
MASPSRRCPAGQVEPKTYRERYHQFLEKHGHPFWPDGAWRDFVFGTGSSSPLRCSPICRAAALDKPPDPSILGADPRPDWYLLWYFALLALIPPRVEGVIMIADPCGDRHAAADGAAFEQPRRAGAEPAAVVHRGGALERDPDRLALGGGNLIAMVAELQSGPFAGEGHRDELPDRSSRGRCCSTKKAASIATSSKASAGAAART